MRLAESLDGEQHAATTTALARGQVFADQAAVITGAVAALPRDLPTEDRQRAQQHLLDLAADHDARSLEVLGRHLLEVIDPDRAEAELAKQLEADETRAARRTDLRMTFDGHGSVHGRFVIPELHGQMLRTALQALANPGRPGPIAREHHEPDSSLGKRATSEVLGQAFVELIERYPVDKLPATGGLNATVVVTIPVATLMGGLAAAAVIGTGTLLSPGEARRLACAAGVIPAVLGGRSRVLDLGRKSRLADGAQRLAKLLEQDGSCGIEHCDRPASWADAHHWKQRWVDGGRTDPDDLILICPRHHTRAHLPG